MNTGFYNMGSIFKPKMPPLPPVAPPPEPPSAELSAEEKARIAADERAMERKRKGRKSTILTGVSGDLTPAELNNPTLLGDKI